jgi:pimeloyl-ACP methyl ester carboxylesterase
MAEPISVDGYRRPSPGVLALEAPRAIGEMGIYAASALMLRTLPRGDGHPVLVLPGFTASDTSTRALRRTLRSWGYFAHGWRLGRNLGPTDEVIDGLDERVESLAERHQQPISLVGWSLGGIYAREAARQKATLVRGVITLGSPFRLSESHDSNAAGMYERLSALHSTRDEVRNRLPETERTPLTVPCTNIFSRTDGVVDWRSCLDEPGALRENIEVYGSHCGLGHNPMALAVIADRLALPAGQWRPFGWQRLRPRVRVRRPTRLAA